MRQAGSVRPTGPTPEEPWCDPEEEQYIPLIGEALDAYMKAHDYRKSKQYVSILIGAFNQFLTSSKLHENNVLWEISKEHGRQWVAYMTTPRQFPTRAIPKAVTVSRKINYLRHFLKWCVGQDWIASNPFESLVIPPRIVSASKTRKEGFSDAELRLIFDALAEYRESTTPARVEFFHCVMLLAFTGPRAAKITQLDTADVKQIKVVETDSEGICAEISVRAKESP
jgi:hypothetical protein